MSHSVFRLVAGVIGCLAAVTSSAQDADLVIRGGKIITADDSFRIVEAMAVKDGRVSAVGNDDALAEHIGDTTRVVELAGRMVLPGLIDSHVHPTSASMFEADHEVPSVETIADVLEYIRQRTQVVPKGKWIKTSQIFITRLREQRFPTRAELDRVAPDHPVFFRTGPDGSVNSLALKENGIDAQFAKQYPDRIPVDENGEPNGLIRRTSGLIKAGATNEKTLTVSEKDDRLVDLLTDYLQTGITGVIDRNCSDAARAQYDRLLKAGRLPVRVRLSRSLNAGAEDEVIEETLQGIARDPLFVSPNPMLGVIGVKVFEDGGMLTGSAFFREPWGLSQIYGISDAKYRGMQYIDNSKLVKLIHACAKRNLAFTAHCQGDAAVEALIDSYREVNQTIPIRPTHSSVTHSSFMSRKAIDGARELGVGVDLQPAWLHLDARTLVAQFGADRLRYFIPLKSLLEAGVVAGGGSDHMQKIGSFRSVNPYNPFLGMWIAVTRNARWHDEPIHLEEALSREQMIRFYTINNAWLMREEDEIGSLEIGKRADFVVVDRDLLECATDDIRDTKVLSAWLDGVKRFEAGK